MAFTKAFNWGLALVVAMVAATASQTAHGQVLPVPVPVPPILPQPPIINSVLVNVTLICQPNGGPNGGIPVRLILIPFPNQPGIELIIANGVTNPNGFVQLSADSINGILASLNLPLLNLLNVRSLLFVEIINNNGDVSVNVCSRLVVGVVGAVLRTTVSVLGPVINGVLTLVADTI